MCSSTGNMSKPSGWFKVDLKLSSLRFGCWAAIGFFEGMTNNLERAADYGPNAASAAQICTSVLVKL